MGEEEWAMEESIVGGRQRSPSCHTQEAHGQLESRDRSWIVFPLTMHPTPAPPVPGLMTKGRGWKLIKVWAWTLTSATPSAPAAAVLQLVSQWFPSAWLNMDLSTPGSKDFSFSLLAIVETTCSEIMEYLIKFTENAIQWCLLWCEMIFLNHSFCILCILCELLKDSFNMHGFLNIFVVR